MSNKRTKKLFKLLKLLFFILIIGFLGIEYNKITNIDKILESKEEIIREQKNQYNKLYTEHQKSQALIKATTAEVKRLSSELKQYKGIDNGEIILIDNKPSSAVLYKISEHIKENEAFSSTPYCDSDGKYHIGYGTLAKSVYYKIGDTVKVKDCNGKVKVLVAKKGKNLLPERKISKEEALERKQNHLVKNVFPYLYGKKFRSVEELIVATDVIYNRGITQSKSLFTKDGMIDCKKLYNYMTHSKKKYQKAMRERYAKNYALCIQS